MASQCDDALIDKGPPLELLRRGLKLTDNLGTPSAYSQSELHSSAGSRGSKRTYTDVDDDSESKRVKKEPTFRADIAYEIYVTKYGADRRTFNLDVRQIMDKPESGSWFDDGFLTASFRKFRQAMVQEQFFIDDGSEHIVGWDPRNGRWQIVIGEFGFQGHLLAQVKEGLELLKFAITLANEAFPSPPSTQHPQRRLSTQSLSVDKFTSGAAGGEVSVSETLEIPTPETRRSTRFTQAVVRPDEFAEELLQQSSKGKGIRKKPNGAATAIALSLKEFPDRTKRMSDILEEGSVEKPIMLEADEEQLSNADDTTLVGEDEEALVEADPEDMVDADMESFMEKAKADPYCAHIEKSEILEACAMFQHSTKRLKAHDFCKLPGIRGAGLYTFQMFGVYLILKLSNGVALAALLADEMGFGKTVITLGWFVVQRWLVIMNEDIFLARERKDAKRHLPKHTSKTQQPAIAQCPSQKEWPILCPCVEANCTSGFKPPIGLTLGVVPPRLVLNWVSEWNNFVDVSHPKLRLKLKVVHKEGKGDLVLSRTEAQTLWIDPDDDIYPSPDHSSIMIITTAASWHLMQSECTSSSSDALGLFSKTVNEKYVPQNRVREINNKHAVQMLWVGAQFIDEVHETHNVNTRAMTHLRDLVDANCECKTLFLSGTPWTTSPRELGGMLSIMEPSPREVNDKSRTWEGHERLQYAISTRFSKLCDTYESLASKKEVSGNDPQVKETMRQVSLIIEAFMIKRSSDTPWFDGPIVKVPKHTVQIRRVPFPSQYRKDLDNLDKIVDRQIGEMTAEWNRIHPGEKQKDTARSSWFMLSYKQRAIATIPALAGLLNKCPDLSFTWEQYCKKKWHMPANDDKNPYIQNLELLIKDCPKLDEIRKEIDNLGTMKKAMYNNKGEKVKDENRKDQMIDVREKLIVVGHNPIVCGILSWAIQKLYPKERVVWMNGKTRQKDRQKIVLDFQEYCATPVSDAPTVLVGAFGIVGTGYTLHRAKKIIITDPDFSIVKEQQTMFRISRIGTVNQTLCVVLECSGVPVEVRIKEMQKRRGTLSRMAQRSREEIAGRPKEELRERQQQIEEEEVSNTV